MPADPEARALAEHWRGWIAATEPTGTTHYEGCERDHHYCGLARLAEAVIELTEGRDDE